MTDPTTRSYNKYECNISSKPYVKKGCLTNHMKKIHEVHDSPTGFLDSTTYSELDREETFMRTTGQIMTADSFLKDILEGADDGAEDCEESTPTATTDPTALPHDSDHVETLNLEPTTTQSVPLCKNANNFIVQKGKTVPASFLETLLPPAGFLQELDRSLQEHDVVDNLLERFEKEIRNFKCTFCEFTCSGMNNLKGHMNDNHPKTSPDPEMPSLGDYLASLERKVDKCYTHMIKQSGLIERLLTRSNSLPITSTEDITEYFKCDQCRFETDTINTMNSHKCEKHEDNLTNNMSSCDQCDKRFNSNTKLKEHKRSTHNKKLVECPMCDYKRSSETEVTEHVEQSHPEKSDELNNQFKCEECHHETDSKSNLESHIRRSHNKESQPVKCPMCNYQNNSVSTLNKHIEERHPEKIECSHCKKDFTSADNLRKHMSDKHKQSSANKVDWGLIIGDSHIKSVQTRRLEKACKGGRLRNPASIKPKTGSAYTTSKYWPNAHFPESNLEERVPKLLSERNYDYMITLTPSNNITNLEGMEYNDQFKMAEETALETLAIVEKALEDSETLKSAVIMELPPRADSVKLQDLSDYCNFVLREAVVNSKHKQKITTGSFDSLYKFSNNDIFGLPSSDRYDGIHLRGDWGSEAFTDCLPAAVRRSRFPSNMSTTTPTLEPISTSNQFQVLSN